MKKTLFAFTLGLLLLSATKAIAEPIAVPIPPTPTGEAPINTPPPPPTQSPSPSTDDDDVDDADVDDADAGDDDAGSDGAEEEGLDEEPKLNPNPLAAPGPDLDKLVELGIGEDLWQLSLGDLPCGDATTNCITQLQGLASTNNPLILEMDARIEEANDRIAEAKTNNRKSVQLSILSPALKVFLTDSTPAATTVGPDGKPVQVQQRRQSVLGKFFSFVTNPLGSVGDELLRAVGIPLLEAAMGGGNDAAQARVIAIGDLQIKVAQMQRDRTMLVDTIRDKVQLAAFELDDARRNFQMAREVAKREALRMQLIDVEYRLSATSISTSSYLSSLSSLDAQKATVWRSWTQVRSRIEKLKLLVLPLE